MVGQPYLLIIASSLGIGLVAGYVMHRADFCVTACFRDLFLFRDTFLLRQMLLLIITSMLLFELGRIGGAIAHYPFPLLGPPALTNLLGGFLFGTGMVLAGGCVCGSLFKLGAGSALSLVAVLGMLAGSAIYAEFHPAWSALTQATALNQGALTLPQSLGITPGLITLPLAGLGAAWLWREFKAGRMERQAFALGHLPPWKAALILALLGFTSYLLIGMPMGITTSYSKLGAGIESWFLPDHVARLAYFSLQPLDYQPPFSAVKVTGGPGPMLDGIAAIQYPLLIGIIAGAACSAIRVGEWHWRWQLPRHQWLSAITGGLLLGCAARMVPSCNVWHLWGGLPILAWQSMLFLIGLLPGTWLGARILIRFVIR